MELAKPAGKRFEVHIRCKGTSQEEFVDLYQEFRKRKLSPARRNPDPLDWGVKAIHEIRTSIGPEVAVAIAGFTAKKVYDWVAAIVKEKIKERNEGKVKVTLYGPNDKPLVTVMRNPDKPKRR